METEPQPQESSRRSSAAASPDRDVHYRILETREATPSALDEFATAVLEGLSERHKKLPSRFIYDDEGSRYFQQIMGLEDYYPTRCEAEILEADGPAILAPLLDGPFNLVDLGAGDGAKTLKLLRHLVKLGADYSFVPIDISKGAMEELIAIVESKAPEAKVEGLVAEYFSALHWLASGSESRRNLVLFLGSNIGNFDPLDARRFLRRLWAALNPGDFVFLGFDLKKDIEVLLRAYNDSQGVTAKFNLNLLARINRELGGHFDLARFRHYSTYDVFSGGMESYLVSLEAQRVGIDALNREFAFKAWEPVHTEYSYKYLISDIDELAKDTGFAIRETFHDAAHWFAGSLWQVQKKRR